MLQNIREFILNIYPTTKLLFALFLSISVFLIPSYIYAYSFVPILMIIAYLAGELKGFINQAIKGLLVFVILLFIIQSLFYPGNTILWEWGIFSIKKEGIDYSLMLSSRILAIGASFVLFFLTTEVKDFVYSLEKIGLPSKAAFVMISTLQIIPEIKKQSLVIMDAQKTRGVETEGNLFVRAKAFLPTLSPLILSSLASTEERAITLESRAFSAPVKKTSLHHIEKTKADTIVRVMLLVLFILLLVWRVFVWIS
ncbi:energy-coupling factor transporter transmembrane component T [Pseudalkalibacillus sp. A8]|uniref:energy-coupling factor transporter transmembrane component T n=1 Tax=Pseudalkalibacillus sp. A8 TaxID=3382641 RepID=UPI0038B51839